MTKLPTFGGTNSQAVSINQTGQITGFSDTSGANDPHAFIDNNGTLTDLGTLGGPDSQGQGINNLGEVVGYSGVAGTGDKNAFLYNGTSMTDLGTLGGDNSYAYRISGPGLIVGKSQITSDADTHAFVYANGKMIDLNTLIDPSLGWDLQDATGVNNAGQITGNGTINGQTHAFLITLVAPTFTSTASKTFKVGVDRTFNITATGSPTPKIKFISGTLPAGVSLVHQGGGVLTLEGTPAPGTKGVYTFTVRAQNEVRPNVFQTFTLTVLGASAAPAVSPATAYAAEPIVGFGSDSITAGGADAELLG